VPILREGFGHLWILLERHPYGIRCDGKAMLFKEVQHAPDTNPRAIVVVAFDQYRTVTNSSGCIRLFPKKRLGLLVSVQDSSLGALASRD
jgi:hypothetical protein